MSDGSAVDRAQRQTLAGLQDDFPLWGIWRPQRKDDVSVDHPMIGSSWCATRRHPDAGPDPTVIRESCEALRRALEEQARMPRI